MFERSRSPSLVCLSSSNIPSVFFDTRDKNVCALLQSEERIQNIRDWDAVIAFSASYVMSVSAIEKASRELACAMSLLLNASTSFQYISKSVASGDIFVGLSCLRFSLESIVRARAILFANEDERKEMLYQYENDIRDHISRNRRWVGEIDFTDNLPRRLGMMLSNPLNASGDFIHDEKHPRSEVLSEMPSKKDGKKADEVLKFQKLLDQFDLPVLGNNNDNIRARVRDWYALSSSFVHADTFSTDLASRILCDPNLTTTVLFEIYLDVTELITDIFSGIAFHLLEELPLKAEAGMVQSFRQKFLIDS